MEGCPLGHVLARHTEVLADTTSTEMLFLHRNMLEITGTRTRYHGLLRLLLATTASIHPRQMQGLDIPKTTRAPEITGLLEVLMGKLEKDRAAVTVRKCLHLLAAGA